MNFNIEKTNENDTQVTYNVHFQNEDDYKKARYTSYLNNRHHFIDANVKRPTLNELITEDFLDNGEQLDQTIILELQDEIENQIIDQFDLDEDYPLLYLSSITYDRDSDLKEAPMAVFTQLKFPEIDYLSYKDYLPEEAGEMKNKMEIQIETIRELSELREQNVRLVPVEEAIEPSHIVNITFLLDDDEEKEIETVDLGMNTPDYIKATSEQLGLTGKKVGEVVKAENAVRNYLVSLYGPGDYSIRINQVYEKEYPEVDDDFAAEVSEFDTIEELQENLSKEIAEANRIENDQSIYAELLNNIIEANEGLFKESWNGIVPDSELSIPVLFAKTYIPKIFQEPFITESRSVSVSLYDKMSDDLAVKILEAEEELLNDEERKDLEEYAERITSEFLSQMPDEMDLEEDEQKRKLLAKRIIGKQVRGELNNASEEEQGE